MVLVVDANILFSFFNNASFTRSFVVKATKCGYKLITPAFCIEELETDKDKIKHFSKIDDKGFALALSAIDSFINTYTESEYEEYLSEARELAPHPKDVPYFALALRFDSPIWSNEKAFKNQLRIKVYSTNELKSML